MNKAVEHENQLIDAIAQLVYDPLGFVYFIFSWGEGQLKDQTGPDVWQADILRQLGDGLITAQEAVQIATASGHGVGKTTVIAWIILWFMSTRPHPQVVVTANTSTQLSTKTWRELAKWHKLSLNSHWFSWTATKFYKKSDPETWFSSAIPWSKERSEAFAGTHEEHVLVIFDESSMIDDAIWEVTEGAMTTQGAVWLVFGNPTRNTGRFKECFNRYRHRWLTRQIDSRTAKMANKKQIDQWIEDYGEDSDFVRVRVKGQFPRASSMQFIDQDAVDQSVSRRVPLDSYCGMPIIIGVDVARFGDDQSVILVRQGLKVLNIQKFREIDTMTLSSLVAQAQDKWVARATFVDVIGIGSGVVDRLIQMGRNVIPVTAGARAADHHKYFNKRAEMWSLMRDWLMSGGQIPDDQELINDLIAPEYGFTGSEQLQLEKKEDMKSRGMASPDVADSLAMTFALPVAPQLMDGEYDYARGAEDVYAEAHSGRCEETGY